MMMMTAFERLYNTLRPLLGRSAHRCPNVTPSAAKSCLNATSHAQPVLPPSRGGMAQLFAHV